MTAVGVLVLLALVGAVVALDLRRSSRAGRAAGSSPDRDDEDDRWSGADPSVQDDGPHGE